MSYRSTLVGRVFVLRWYTSPTLADLKLLGTELTENRKRVGQPLLCLSLLPLEVSLPESAVRNEMDRFNRLWADTCETVYVILGGDGFKHAMVRSLVSGLALATAKRGLVQVYRTIDEALEKMKESPTVDPSAIRLRIVSQKLAEGL